MSDKLNRLLAYILTAGYFYCFYLTTKEHASLLHYILDGSCNLLLIMSCLAVLGNYSSASYIKLRSFLIGELAYYIFWDFIGTEPLSDITIFFVCLNTLYCIWACANNYPTIINALTTKKWYILLQHLLALCMGIYVVYAI
jgi:hypothetical protein